MPRRPKPANPAAAASTEPRYPGRPVHVGPRELVIPSLTIGDFRRLSETLVRIRTPQDAAADPMAQLEDVVTIVHAAAVRNYPTVTKDELVQLLDVPTLLNCLRAALALPEPPAPAAA